MGLHLVHLPLVRFYGVLQVLVPLLQGRLLLVFLKNLLLEMVDLLALSSLLFLELLVDRLLLLVLRLKSVVGLCKLVLELCNLAFMVH